MKKITKKYLTDSESEEHINQIDDYMVHLPSVHYNKSLVEGYRNIVVVGNQRSGTTFTGKVIAKDLGYTYKDENTFNIRDESKFLKLNNQKKSKLVFQAPALTYKMHKLVTDDDLVIFMNRNWSDILRSVKRKNKKLSQYIFLKGDESMYELQYNKYIEYDSGYSKLFDNNIDDSDKYTFSLMYKAWLYYQQDIIKNTLTLDYESLQIHPMWLDKGKRKKFKPKQTKL